MIRLKYLVAFFGLGLSLAYATAPLSPASSYIGLDYMQMAGDWNSLNEGAAACFSEGCGGEFAGNITTNGLGPSSLPTAAAANFWCVDYQENFDYNYQGYADVVALSNVTGNAQVRYSNVGTGGAAPTWTDDLGSAYDTAQVRYEMAAWLVSQYPGVLGNPGDPIITSGSTADAIQQAMWVIMSNTSSGNGFSSQFTTGDVFEDSALVNQYISQAQLYSNYGNVTDQWGIVSWTADPNSNPAGALNANGANYQTFLVDLSGSTTGGQGPTTPEPAFYGVLAMGLSGLVFAARRRQKV